MLGVPVASAQEKDAAKPAGKDAKLPGRLFVSCPVPGSEATGIAVVDPNAFTIKRISEIRTDHFVSPDGHWVAETRRSKLPDVNGVWLLETEDKAAPRRVFEEAGVVSWSGNSQQIMVSVPDNPPTGRTFANWAMNLDGKRGTKLAIPDTDEIIDWSRDGSWVLTISARTRRDGSPPLRRDQRPVWIMHPDGTAAKVVITDPLEGAAEKPAASTYYPRFSPDSRSVVYCRYLMSRESGRSRFQSEVWTIGLNDAKPRRVIAGHDQTTPLSAVWSPDSKLLAVSYRDILRDGNRETTSASVKIVNLAGEIVREARLAKSPVLIVTDWR
jgi:hypothetical protein